MFESLFCLDAPELIEFQGGRNKLKEQTFVIELTGCTDPSLDCVTDEDEVNDFLKGREFVTVMNKDTYNPDVYDEDTVITS